MALALFLIACVVTVFTHIQGSPVAVDVSRGRVRGDWSKEDGVTRFLGVPYASPPVGDLRFALPMESTWGGEIDCTATKPVCPQDANLLSGISSTFKQIWNMTFQVTMYDEDCLYMNIFIPGEVQSNHSLPVMVHFQDGNFQVDLVDVYDGSHLARTGNVIVVTFSARVGTLGFYGKHNLGLYDQLQVLKWVQDNIMAFGGDKDRVTLFGSGSGGFSVGLHVMSAASRGLFKRAISQGATIFDRMLVNSQPEAVTEAFNKAVGCEESDMSLQMICLRKLSVDEILTAQVNLTSQYLTFMPTVDGKILPAPIDKLMLQVPNNVDYMIGVNSNGGTAGIYDFYQRLQTGATKEYFHQFLYGAAAIGFPSNQEVAREAIAYEYAPMGDNVDNIQYFRAIISLMRDSYLSMVRGAQLMHSTAGRNVYAFYFDQAAPVMNSVPADLVGVPSGVEVFFLFRGDSDFGRRLQKTWASFAETGKPVLELADGSQVNWPKFTAADKKTAILGGDVTQSMTVMDSLDSDLEKKISFWTELLPMLTSQDDTCEETKTPSTGHEENPVVKLKQGHVMGRKRMTRDNHFEYEEFLDIPYAAPPVGDLRFRPPQPHQGWDDVLNRTREMGVKACPQFVMEGAFGPSEVHSEDCLTLDIQVPYGVAYVRYRKLPVMFWIHGGGYVSGSKNIYNGVGLIQRDVIYVGINYRLGSLGFLATGDKASSGNYGLMDQHFALKWVKENIAHFGGDPDEITIFGQSAGSGGVMAQVVAPVNKGMFKRAIAQSGTILATWSLNSIDRAKSLSEKLAQAFNCSSGSSYMMVNCLRKVDAMEMVTAEIMSSIFMAPVVDGAFITKDPKELYNEEVTRNITILMGRTVHEGFTPVMMGPLFDVAYLPILSSQSGPSFEKAFNFYYEDLFEARRKSLNDSDTIVRSIDLYTDGWQSAFVSLESKLHVANGGRLYRYLYNYHTPYPLFPGGHKKPAYVKGDHGDDLAFVFGFACVDTPEYAAFNYDPVTTQDKHFCNAVMDMWTNFAHTGDPMKGGRDFAADWPLYTLDAPYIFDLNEDAASATGKEQLLTVSGNPEYFRPRKIALWTKLRPELMENDEPKPCNDPATTQNP